MMIKRLVAGIVIAVIFVSCGPELLKPNNMAVDTLNVGKCFGTWYEIARYENIFEMGDYDSMFELTQDRGDCIRVDRTSLKKGVQKKSSFRLKRKGGEKSGRFRVRTWKPFFSDCRVIMTADDYSWMVVGSRKFKYLWILSRTAHIPSNDLYGILYSLSARHYDTDMLSWVKRTD